MTRGARVAPSAPPRLVRIMGGLWNAGVTSGLVVGLFVHTALVVVRRWDLGRSRSAPHADMLLALLKCFNTKSARSRADSRSPSAELMAELAAMIAADRPEPGPAFARR